MRLKIAAIFVSAFAVALTRADVDGLKLEYHGAGWVQAGRVEKSFALQNASNAYEKNWVGQSGGLIGLSSTIDEHWDGALGLGTVLVQLARGSKAIANKWYPFWVAWVDEARFTYSNTLFSDKDNFKLTLGTFHYGYNPDAKNLGLYLMHGYVYPGTLVSGFTGPLGVYQVISGAQASYKTGWFSNDLMLQSETEDKPLYDFSISDVATLRPHAGFEIGVGVNLYRLIPMNKKATSPGKDCNTNLLGVNADRGQGSSCFILEKNTVNINGVDTVLVDTILGSLAGTKLMGRFRVDPKALFGFGESMGKDDLVLYGEAAVLGLKNYPQVYEDILRRIPVMVGFNFPGWNLLNASVEVEYYASKNSGDNLGAKNGSWVPAFNPQVNTKRDDIKWSFNASKVLAGHVAVMGQVANDHLRLGGNHDEDTGIEALTTPMDWYWTTKIAYFF